MRRPAVGGYATFVAQQQARCAMGKDAAGVCGFSPPAPSGQDQHRGRAVGVKAAVDVR
jgi:hypothetical protein